MLPIRETCGTMFIIFMSILMLYKGLINLRDPDNAEPLNPLYRPTVALLGPKLRRNRTEQEMTISETKYLRVEAWWSIGFGIFLLAFMGTAAIITILS